ncbi:MAG: hypothetical protein Q7S55_01300 [Nanoarchaeota archaeon]|nr:hypothetical protein [Nanoarchaeota archaeon]
MSHTKTLDPVEQNRKSFRRGVLTGGVTVGVITVLLSSCDSCQGNTKPVPQDNYIDAAVHKISTSDAGITDITDIIDASTITAACPEGQSCYSDDKICKKGADCYSIAVYEALESNLETCLAENETLSKRPKSCPTYTPKPCPIIKELPPVKECPKIPYIRKGD